MCGDSVHTMFTVKRLMIKHVVVLLIVAGATRGGSLKFPVEAWLSSAFRTVYQEPGPGGQPTARCWRDLGASLERCPWEETLKWRMSAQCVWKELQESRLQRGEIQWQPCVPTGETKQLSALEGLPLEVPPGRPDSIAGTVVNHGLYMMTHWLLEKLNVFWCLLHIPLNKTTGCLTNRLLHAGQRNFCLNYFKLYWPSYVGLFFFTLTWRFALYNLDFDCTLFRQE